MVALWTAPKAKACLKIDPNERRTTMKKKLNIYEEPKLEILTLDVQDVITSSGGANPFMGEDDDLSGFFGQGSDGYTG